MPEQSERRQLAGNTGSLPGEELVTGQAGTVVIMNAHMWHGGTASVVCLPSTTPKTTDSAQRPPA